MITASELAGFIPSHAIWCGSDAIILEMRAYAFPWAKATLAVPYTPATTGRFRVHEPKVVEWHKCDFDMNAALEAFFSGVDSHEKGSAVWNAALIQSK